MAKTLTTYLVNALVIATLFAGTLAVVEAPVLAFAQTTAATQQTSTSASANTGQNVTQGTLCDGSNGWGIPNWLSSPFTCGMRYMVEIFASLLVSAASWLLTFSGLLFDSVINLTVLQFGDLMNTGVMDAINTAWSAFRDIANIVIIGMFVFVAIQTILGSHEYGARKMIARLLIVAVLINFSLLFTKLIIDASNFTADQFYTAMAQGNSALTPVAGGNPQVAEAFMSFAGVSGFGNTLNAVHQLAENVDNVWIAMVYGIGVAVFFTAAAIILFYGSFLLIARALLMIFLMLTSSIAFATYLIPGASKGRFGWSAWWSSLLNNAILAPLFFVLLWVSLSVGRAFQSGLCAATGSGTTACGAMGDLIADPLKAANFSAFFVYIIVLGLLFVSFRVSASFSKEIGGFDYAAMLTALPFASTARFIAAPALRFSSGNTALAREHALEHDIEAESRRLSLMPASQRDYSTLTKLMKDKATAAKDAHRTYDLMNTKVGQAIGKATGLPSALTEKTKTNAAETAKASAEAAAKKATEAAISKSTAKEVVMGEDQIKQQRESLQLQREAAAAAKETAKTVADQKKQEERLSEKLATAQQNAHREEGEAINEKIRADEQLRQRAITQEQHKQILDEQSQRIKNAHAAVQNIQQRMEFHDRDVKTHEQQLADIDKQQKALEKHIDERATELSNETTKVAQEMAAKFGQRTSTKIAGAVASVFGETVRDDTTAQMARDLVKKKVGARSVKAQVQAQQDLLKDAGEAPAAPPQGTGGNGDSHH